MTTAKALSDRNFDFVYISSVYVEYLDHYVGWKPWLETKAVKADEYIPENERDAAARNGRLIVDIRHISVHIPAKQDVVQDALAIFSRQEREVQAQAGEAINKIANSRAKFLEITFDPSVHDLV